MKAIFSSLLFCLLLSTAAFSQEARKFDEFENPTCEDYLGRMDNVIVQARDDLSLTVYALIYEGKESIYNVRKNKFETVFPAFGSAEAKIRSIKKYLSYRKLPVKRFSFVKAGFRENAVVEIWLVPNGATPPTATPTLRKMKYRKGKASGFCVNCC